MGDNRPLWTDYANLVLTIALGMLGIYVAVQVSRSSDRLSEHNLIVTTATFLLDDTPKRQAAGVEIVRWLADNKVTMPAWAQCVIEQITAHAATPAPSNSNPTAQTASADPVPYSDTCAALGAPPQPASGQPVVTQDVANRLFGALGGASPRLFIEIAEEEQRAGANSLRRALGQIQLSGQQVVAPAVEKVSNPPSQTELRFLKSADQTEANALAEQLVQLLGMPVAVKDLSGQFGNKANVKPRTYEIWFPRGAIVRVGSAKS